MKRSAVRFIPLAIAAMGFAPFAAQAADSSILGRWRIVDAQPAPWSSPGEQVALTAAGKRMIDTEVPFAPGSVKSKFKPWDCKSKVIYTPIQSKLTPCFRAIYRSPTRRALPCALAFHGATFRASMCAASRHCSRFTSATPTPR